MRSFIRDILPAAILLATAASAAHADPVDTADPYALDRSDPTSVARAYVRAVKAGDFAFAYGLADPKWHTAEAPERGSEEAAVIQMWSGSDVAECFRVAHSAKLTVSQDARTGRSGVVFGLRTNPVGLMEDPCILMLSSHEDRWYVDGVGSIPAAFLGKFAK
ncbi:MAG TPA: hypothetical protein PLR76_03860 [Hyphomonas sp.]|nr:hypothetical protein [Hyphomonas sp.]